MEIHAGTDLLEGRMMDMAFLRKCIKQVRSKYKPVVLILSELDFRRQVNLAFHGLWEHAKSQYASLGLEKIIWAKDLKEGEFLLSSGAGIATGIETLYLQDHKETNHE